MDPISDMFIRIKNAQRARHESVRMPYSRMKHEIVKILEREGLVGAVEKKGKRVKKILEAKLLYDAEGPLIREVKLVSKPSRRVYASYKDLPPARQGGVIVVSTPKGILSGREARKERVGGEVIAEVW